MKCPHCGREIETVTPSVVIAGVDYDLQKESLLPLGEVAKKKFYKSHDPGVERPTLILVSPHEQ